MENPFEFLNVIFLSNPVFYKTGKIFPFAAVSQLVLTKSKLKQSEGSSKKLVPNVLYFLIFVTCVRLDSRMAST